MKTTFQYCICLFVLSILFVSCGKTVDTPAIVTPTDPLIGGATSAYKDTVTLSVNGVSIKYSRTAQCYPSNEIFMFTASFPGADASITYNWDFGDGQTMVGATAQNIYQKAGSYTVKLDIKNDQKMVLNTGTFSLKAYGQQVTPHAAFYATVFDISKPNNMAFTSQSTVPNGTLNYIWDWGDGTSQTSTLNAYNVLHNFPDVPSDKNYPIKLIAVSSAGCKDTATVSLSVGATYNITGSFDAVTHDLCTNEYILFTSNATGVPEGATYSWDFSDATGTATGNPVKHYFTYANVYRVVMTIKLNGKEIYKTGNSGVTAYGQNIKPLALFGKSFKYEDAASSTWEFYAQDNIPHGQVIDYLWDLGNGKKVTGHDNNDVLAVYPKAATVTTYPVKFIVTANSGCKDTASTIITVPAK